MDRIDFVFIKYLISFSTIGNEVPKKPVNISTRKFALITCQETINRQARTKIELIVLVPTHLDVRSAIITMMPESGLRPE